jgi:hypothetical protein
VRPRHSRPCRPSSICQIKRDLIPMGLARGAPPDRELPAQRAAPAWPTQRPVPPALRAHARSARPSGEASAPTDHTVCQECVRREVILCAVRRALNPVPAVLPRLHLTAPPEGGCVCAAQ